MFVHAVITPVDLHRIYLNQFIIFVCQWKIKEYFVLQQLNNSCIYNNVSINTLIVQLSREIMKLGVWLLSQLATLFVVTGLYYLPCVYSV